MEKTDHSSYEMGRVSEQMRSLTGAVQSLTATVHKMSEDFARQRDLERVEDSATDALAGANRANTRIDSMSLWEKIGAAVLAAIILWSLKLGR